MKSKNKKQETPSFIYDSSMITYDSRLDKYENVILFPKKLELAEKKLRDMGMYDNLDKKS